MTLLGERLRERVAAGRKLLVPYIVGGLPDRTGFAAALQEIARHADAVEVGLPFSDPLMDGPVIAAAATRVLDAGVRPLDALALAGVDTEAPRIVMTYYNPIHRTGEERFCELARESGIAGLIVPDLPLEEARPLIAAAAAAGLAWIPLVTPTTTPQRARGLVATATGFVYAVSTLGVTGVRDSLSGRAEAVVSLCRDRSDVPVLIGIGISNADQARAAASVADGVVVGSAVVAAVTEGGVDAAAALLAGIRAALDEL